MNVTKKQRLAFPDALKSISILAVILMHTVSGFMDSGALFDTEDLVQFLIIRDMTSWCVPVFLMVSGFFFLNPEKTFSYKDIFSKYLKRIVIAILSFGTLFAAAELFLTEGFSALLLPKAILGAVTGNTWAHMWYLYLIFALYLITPILRFLSKKIPTIFIILLEVVLFVFGSVLPFWNAFLSTTYFTFGGPTIYLFFYLAGYLFTKLSREHALGKAILFTILLGILFSGYGALRMIGFGVMMGYNAPITVLEALLLFLIFFFLEDRLPGTKFFQSVSALSFGMYLIHPVFLNLFYKVLHITLYEKPFPWFILLLCLISTLGSALITFLLRKIKFIKKAVL